MDKRTHVTFANDLRDLADWVESHSHPELQIPGLDRVDIFPHDDGESLPLYAKAMGTVEKEADDSFFMLRKNFGSIQLEVNWWREQVCERVKVGEKVIPEQIFPAKSEEIIPEHVENVYEWKCPESILTGKKGA